MYAIFGAIGILFIAAICEAFFDLPVIGATRNAIGRLCTGRGYLRFFGLTALSALALYGVGIAALGAFIGIYTAGTEVGTLCLLIFMGGMLRCVFSTGRDIYGLGSKVFTGVDKRGNSEFSVFSSFIFVTGLWGCIILLTFYDHSRSGALLSVSVHAPTL